MVLVTRFKRWLLTAPAGDAYPYHLGYLARDRFEDQDGTVPNEIDVLAKAAVLAHEKGQVHLRQIKLMPGVYEYLAIRRRRDDIVALMLSHRIQQCLDAAGGK